MRCKACLFPGVSFHGQNRLNDFKQRKFDFKQACSAIPDFGLKSGGWHHAILRDTGGRINPGVCHQVGLLDVSHRQPDDPFSTRISVQGAVSVGGVYNIELENGASAYPGDYLYRSGLLKWDVESGMWGIFRVMKKGIHYCCECVCRTFGNWWEKKWFDRYE